MKRFPEEPQVAFHFLLLFQQKCSARHRAECSALSSCQNPSMPPFSLASVEPAAVLEWVYHRTTGILGLMTKILLWIIRHRSRKKYNQKKSKNDVFLEDKSITTVYLGRTLLERSLKVNKLRPLSLLHLHRREMWCKNVSRQHVFTI